MLIICKSCKKLVDTDKHDFCPKCGSNFNYGENLKIENHTEDYEEYERRMAEQQRAAVENRMNNTKQATKKETQRRLKNQANQAQGKKNGCSGCVAAIVIAVFGFGVLSGIIEESDFDIDEFLNEEFGTVQQTTAYTVPEIPDIYYDLPEFSDNYTDSQTTEEDSPSYLVGVGETAYTEKYALTCTEVSLYENEFLPADEGYRYISFTLSLENTTDSSRMYFGNIRCISIEECAQAGFSGIFFPGELEAGGVYEKSVIFQVPEEEYFYDIYFDNEVIIYTSVADIEGYFDEYTY